MVQFYFLQVLVWLLHFRVIDVSSRNSVAQVDVLAHSALTASCRPSIAPLPERFVAWDTNMTNQPQSKIVKATFRNIFLAVASIT